MKKLMMIMAIAFGLAFTASARDTYSRDASVLPKAAQSYISNNFKAKISLVKTEKTIGAITSYEVILNDGSEISFDKNGNWDEIEVPAGKEVPAGFVPQGIRNYVKAHHSGQKIVGIDKGRGGYDVELSNNIEIKFDKNGNFLRYDD